jgi:phosphatidylglycerophosphate synthase
MNAAAQSVNSFHITGPDSAPDIWAMRPETRLARQMAKLGLLAYHPQDTGFVLLVRRDVIYDMAVLKGLAQQPGSILILDNTPVAACVTASDFQAAESYLTSSSAPPDKCKILTPAQAAGAYNLELRKSEPPACYILREDNCGHIEWKLFQGSYKGVTDLVTKYAWPVPAFHATRLCAKLGLTPNMVTTIGAVLMFAALWAFWIGVYGWGLLAGWIMTFLDTVDGKLARVTVTSSKWGNIFDHGLDLLHPPFWYIAWGIGLAAYGVPLPAGWLGPMLWTMFGFYVLGRLCEGYFMRRFGMHLHVWRRFDSRFRLILARRNPNMIMLSLCWLAGRPDIGLILVTAWTVITFLVHVVQTAQAEFQNARGHKITSWLDAA